MRGKPKFNMRPLAGRIAQLVEQRTENPCVPGSIPGPATTDLDAQIGLNKGDLRVLFSASNGMNKDDLKRRKIRPRFGVTIVLALTSIQT